MYKRTLIASILLLALMLTACGVGASQDASTTLNVDLTDFAFNPMNYTVPAGEQIALNLSNKGAVQHEFVIMKAGTQVTSPFSADDEPNIYWETELDPGNMQSLTFTAPSQPGEYQVVCGIAGHMEAGMVGTLIVK